MKENTDKIFLVVQNPNESFCSNLKFGKQKNEQVISQAITSMSYNTSAHCMDCSFQEMKL